MAAVRHGSGSRSVLRLIFLLFHLAGGMGGGDVKLITAAGSIAGLSLIAPLLILTSLTGGVMALGLALYRRRLKETLINVCTLAVYHGTVGLAPHPEFNIGQCANAALALWVGDCRRQRTQPLALGRAEVSNEGKAPAYGLGDRTGSSRACLRFG